MTNVDFESANLSEVHRVSRGESPSVEPVAEVPVADATAPAESPSPEPVAVPAAEPAATQPDQATAGSPPPDQPPPASDVPTDSAYEAMLKRHGGDREKLAAEFLRIESDLASRVRAEKAKPAAPTTEPQPAVPVPAVPPPAAVAPEPPGPSASPQVDVQVQEFADRDPECRALYEQFTATTTDLRTVGVLDANGRFVGGRIAEIDTLIADATAMLRGPSDGLKKLGIEVPTLDALARQDLESQVSKLKLERIEHVDTFREGQQYLRSLSNQFHARRNGFRAHLESQELGRRAEAESEARINDQAAVYSRQWDADVASALKTNNVPENLWSRYKKVIGRAARAHQAQVGDFDPATQGSFIESVIREEKEAGDEYHRSRSAEYAAVKNADQARLNPAPTGAAAVAKPATTETTDFEERNRQAMRDLTRARRSA